jgi:hypothetical protein
MRLFSYTSHIQWLVTMTVNRNWHKRLTDNRSFTVFSESERPGVFDTTPASYATVLFSNFGPEMKYPQSGFFWECIPIMSTPARCHHPQHTYTHTHAGSVITESLKSGALPEFFLGGGGGADPEAIPYTIYVWFWKLCYKSHVVSITYHCLQLHLHTCKYNYMLHDSQWPIFLIF